MPDILHTKHLEYAMLILPGARSHLIRIVNHIRLREHFFPNVFTSSCKGLSEASKQPQGQTRCLRQKFKNQV